MIFLKSVVLCHFTRKLLEFIFFSLDEEIERKKQVIGDIKMDFEKLRSDLQVGVKESENQIRKDEYETHMQKNEILEDGQKKTNEDIKEYEKYNT